MFMAMNQLLAKMKKNSSSKFFMLGFLLFLQIQFCSSSSGLDTGGLTRDGFPAGFEFGTATSAYQVEGAASTHGRGPSIWDVFVQQPGRIANNATGERSVDEYHRFKEDIDLMVKMNIDAYRFSISWSRIFPEGVGRVNEEGVSYYNRLIDYMILKGITPYANLYHYDLPEALEKSFGGLLSRKVVKAYADYADFCFKTYGDRVKNWMTFNEPKVTAAQGYDIGTFAPGRCLPPQCAAGNSSTEPYIVAHNLILSHAAAVKRYRHKYRAEQNGRIGIILDFVWYEPLTNKTEDIEAAQRARDFHLGWFLHPIVHGSYPKSMQEIVGERLPKFTRREVGLVKGSIDYVGINQYTSYYIYDPHLSNHTVTSYQGDWNAGFAYERDGVPIGPRAHSSWLYIVPWGIYDAVTYVKEHYNNPIIVLSENGMDDAGNLTIAESLHDLSRINYYRGYLTHLKRAIDDGANVISYFAWSMLDNFEWLSGYTSRFGLHYVDYTNLKRHPKMSAHWFRRVLRRKHH